MTQDSAPGTAAPSPERFYYAATAYQTSSALKAGVDLSLFTAIGEGARTTVDIARRCAATERGVRILCNALTVAGFLEKSGHQYTLAPDTAVFLDEHSPAYIGGALEFLHSPHITGGFSDLAGMARGNLTHADSALAPDHEVWVRFARAMAPLTAITARRLADIVNGDDSPHIRVLDIAAGHGMFGVTVAAQNPNAEVVAVDWTNVLEVATENAEKAGVADRHRLLRGSAFDVEFGTGFDVALLTNFLHHFDAETNTTLLRKVRECLKDGGRAIVLEFVPNEDGVSPPAPAIFALNMLANTPSGEAYRFSELERIYKDAGFVRVECCPLPPTAQTAVIGYK